MKQAIWTRNALLWAGAALPCLLICALMFGLYRESGDARIEAARGSVAAACSTISQGYADAGEAASRGDAPVLEAVLQRALGAAPGVEGGYWRSTQGFLAYAYPTYEGTGVKRDVPQAEAARLVGLAQRSLAARADTGFVQQGERGALVFQACLTSSVDTVAWVMLRIERLGSKAYGLMLAALIALLAMTLAMSLYLARLFANWRRGLGEIEATLSGHTLVHLRDFAHSGDAELDRIVAALNDFNARARREHEANEELSQKLVQSERMAALGRLASGLAHEIRNPLAAVRLKIENALAAPPGAERLAMGFTLNQVARLERLLSGLLSLTQALKLSPGRVPLDAWMRERLASVQPQAEAAGVHLQFIHAGVPESWTFDPDHLARAVENLLLNAIAHSPRGGRIELGVAADAATLRIHVQDEGVGLDPAVREQIFEPFVTGREDGVGLGLTLARAVAVAHGGTLHNVPVAIGARFELEVPWLES
jgi:signal transduction histidine kinase